MQSQTVANEFDKGGKPAFMADCGHLIPPLPAGHVGGTGYATSHDTNKTMCYACAAAATVADMERDGQGGLYIVVDRTDSDGWKHYRLQDWASQIKLDVFNVTRSTGCGFGRAYPIVTGRFRLGGKLWAFRNAGDNQIARCRRLKDPR